MMDSSTSDPYAEPRSYPVVSVLRVDEKGRPTDEAAPLTTPAESTWNPDVALDGADPWVVYQQGMSVRATDANSGPNASIEVLAGAVEPDAGGTSTQRVVVASSVDGSTYEPRMRIAAWSGDTWVEVEPPSVSTPATPPGPAVASDGLSPMIRVAWVDQPPETLGRIAFARLDGATWRAEHISGSEGYLYPPAIDSHGDQVAVAWFARVADHIVRLRAAWSADGGETWSPPTTLTEFDEFYEWSFGEWSRRRPSVAVGEAGTYVLGSDGWGTTRRFRLDDGAWNQVSEYGGGWSDGIASSVRLGEEPLDILGYNSRGCVTSIFGNRGVNVTSIVRGRGRIVLSTTGDTDYGLNETCRNRCTARVGLDDHLRATAIADRGWRFVRWEEDCSSTRRRCSVVADAALRLRAVFAAAPR